MAARCCQACLGSAPDGVSPLPALPGQLIRQRAGTVALLHQGAGSTIDHFLRAPLEQQGLTLLDVDSSQPPQPGQLALLAELPLIVVVRYLTAPWQAALRQLRRSGCRLAYLMDDDLLDPGCLSGLPQPYRRRLQQRITRRRHLVPALFDHIWVTSAVLADRYGHLGARLLPLQPHASLLVRPEAVQLAYLGTTVHQAEFHWLLDLFSQIQQRHGNTQITVFGDLAINRLLRHLPRLRVIHPMPWGNYLAATGCTPIDLLLCPLLASHFNAARAAVKFIDAARCGAAGLYSDRAPYRGFVRDGVDGLLLDDQHSSWLMQLEALIGDPQRRRQLAAACRQRALELSHPPLSSPVQLWETPS